MRRAMGVLIGLLVMVGVLIGPPIAEAVDSCAVTGTYGMSGFALGDTEVLGFATFTPNGTCTGGTFTSSVTIKLDGSPAQTITPAGTYVVNGDTTMTITAAGLLTLSGLVSQVLGNTANAIHAVGDVGSAINVGLTMSLTALGGPPLTCPPDAVRSGPTCIDKYEASVWQVINPVLIAKIKNGTVTLADLTGPIATQFPDMSTAAALAACPANGNGCKSLYAVSIPGVTPTSSITWFQAAAAARNAGKRLPTNAEWQAAALGTPDPGVSAAGSQDCNTKNGGGAGADAGVLTGSRSNCVSDVGAFDMVGNLMEWVADWVPQSTVCVPPLFAGDLNCLGGADTLEGPGALIRGGFFSDGAGAGVFAVFGLDTPSSTGPAYGFRAAR